MYYAFRHVTRTSDLEQEACQTQNQTPESPARGESMQAHERRIAERAGRRWALPGSATNFKFPSHGDKDLQSRTEEEGALSRGAQVLPWLLATWSPQIQSPQWIQSQVSGDLALSQTVAWVWRLREVLSQLPLPGMCCQCAGTWLMWAAPTRPHRVEKRSLGRSPWKGAKQVACVLAAPG